MAYFRTFQDSVCTDQGRQERTFGHTVFRLSIKPTTSSGSGSVVSMATGYVLDGPEIESRWGARFSSPVQTGPGLHPSSCTMGTGSFPGGKERPGRDPDPSPTSSAFGHERVELYLYSSYGLYGLHRASVPAQG